MSNVEGECRRRMKKGGKKYQRMVKPKICSSDSLFILLPAFCFSFFYHIGSVEIIRIHIDSFIF